MSIVVISPYSAAWPELFTRSPFWEEHLRFRDLLRTNPGLASRYAALKLRLAQEHALDKAAYTAAKAPFIQAVLSGEIPEGGGTLP